MSADFRFTLHFFRKAGRCKVLKVTNVLAQIIKPRIVTVVGRPNRWAVLEAASKPLRLVECVILTNHLGMIPAT